MNVTFTFVQLSMSLYSMLHDSMGAFSEGEMIAEIFVLYYHYQLKSSDLDFAYNWSF